jgi:hypothetical protein
MCDFRPRQVCPPPSPLQMPEIVAVTGAVGPAEDGTFEGTTLSVCTMLRSRKVVWLDEVRNFMACSKKGELSLSKRFQR